MILKPEILELSGTMCINHYVTHPFLGCCACETPSNRCWSQPYVGKAGRESCFSLPCCCADFGSAGRVDQWNGKPMPLEVSMMCCLTAALDISGNFSCMTALWCFKLCLWWCVHTVEQGNKEAKQFYCSELTNPNVGISKIKTSSRFGSQPVQAVCRPHGMAKLMRQDHGCSWFTVCRKRVR